MSRDSPAEVQCHGAALKDWRPIYLEPQRPGEACSWGAGLEPECQGNCTWDWGHDGYSPSALDSWLSWTASPQLLCPLA